MKFRGFNGEKVEVIKRRDSLLEHDHLIIKIDGEEVGYFHIVGNKMDFFSPLLYAIQDPTVVASFKIQDLRYLR
jgi:hypothetical protein